MRPQRKRGKRTSEPKAPESQTLIRPDLTYTPARPPCAATLDRPPQEERKQKKWPFRMKADVVRHSATLCRSLQIHQFSSQQLVLLSELLSQARPFKNHSTQQSDRAWVLSDMADLSGDVGQ